MGVSAQNMHLNIAQIIEEEIEKSTKFENDNPEVLLPTVLEIEKEMTPNPSINREHVDDHTNHHPQIKTKDTWSQVVQRSIDADNTKAIIK